MLNLAGPCIPTIFAISLLTLLARFVTLSLMLLTISPIDAMRELANSLRDAANPERASRGFSKLAIKSLSDLKPPRKSEKSSVAAVILLNGSDKNLHRELTATPAIVAFRKLLKCSICFLGLFRILVVAVPVVVAVSTV